MNNRTEKATASIPQTGRVSAVSRLIGSQLVLLELGAIGLALHFLQRVDASAQTVAALLLFLLATFTLITGKGFPHFRHRGKALLVMALSGFFALSGAAAFHDAREARLADLRGTNPTAYLAELHDIDEQRWLSELKQMDPETYRRETDRRATEAEAQRLAQCTDKKAGEAYVMIQSDVLRQLRAPSTAKFPSRYGAGTRHVGDCVYQVFGQFDAQNGFGAMLRGGFSGTIRYFPESGSWQTQKLDVQG